MKGEKAQGENQVTPPLRGTTKATRTGNAQVARRETTQTKVRTCGASRTEQDDHCNYLSAGVKLTRNVTL